MSKTIKQKNEKKRIFYNSLLVFTATVIENAIFFIINIIIARYLSLEHFGEYSTALGYATFFSTLTNIGINQTLVKVINMQPGLERENFSAAFFLKILTGFIVYGAMAVSLYFTNYSGDLVLLTLIMGIFRIGNELLSAFYTFYDAREDFLKSSVFKIIFPVCFLILTLYVIFVKGGLFDFAYTRLALVVLFFVILIITSKNIFTHKIDFRVLTRFLNESIPFGILNILWNVFQRTNIIILSLLHGSIYTGVFSNGFIFFTTLFLIPANIVRVLLPFLYKLSYKRDRSKFRFAYDIYTKYMTIISFYFMTGAVLYSGNIIRLIFGSRYAGSATVLRIIAPGIPFIFTVAPTLMISLGKQKQLTVIYLYGLVINLVSNTVLIYFFRSEGAAFAAVITYGFILSASTGYLKLKRFIGIYGTLKAFAGQVMIFIVCLASHRFLFINLYWMASLVFVTIIFALLNLVFVINKNDARILRETLNIKKFPVRIYR